MKTILVTGAAGNIGSSLCSELLKINKFKVVGVDNLSTGSRSKLPINNDGFKFFKIDVNDYHQISSLFYSNNFDYVFHFAAVVGVQRTIDNPLSVLGDIDGIKHILQLSKNSGINRVFFSSSSEVYGEPVSMPQNEETTPLNSRLPYAIVKNLGESYLNHITMNMIYRIQFFVFFNTYGPNQSSDFVMIKFIKAALLGNDITIYGDGSQTRTFCYIDDNINTMIKCLEHDLFVNDVINIGSDKEITILDLAKLVIKLTKSSSKNRAPTSS